MNATSPETMDWTKTPAPVRHARLLNIVQQVQNELEFSNFAEENPEAEESISALLQEAHELVRSLQSQGNTAVQGDSNAHQQASDLTMVPE